MNPVVDGIGKKYEDKVASAVVSARSAEGREAAQKYGLQKGHGLVAVDPLGNPVYVYDGHDLPPEQVEDVVKRLLKAR